VPAPEIPAPWTAALDAYAAFTATQAQRVLSSGSPLEPVRARLFSKARDLGSRLRAVLRVRSSRRAGLVMRALYKVIGVDFRSTGGEFTVAKCFFSSRYSPAVCQLISSLDAGLFTGLSGGITLEFRRRITGGFACCTGILSPGVFSARALRARILDAGVSA